jgi:hypothetical protein
MGGGFLVWTRVGHSMERSFSACAENEAKRHTKEGRDLVFPFPLLKHPFFIFLSLLLMIVSI